MTEFLEGFENVSEGEVLLRAYTRVDVDSRVASRAAVIRRKLRMTGDLIGDFDILIAATAMVENVALVTRNLADFKRIEGLSVVAY